MARVGSLPIRPENERRNLTNKPFGATKDRFQTSPKRTEGAAPRLVKRPLRRATRIRGRLQKIGDAHTPPSTTRLAPVMNRAAEEAKNSTASATSSR